MDYLRVTQVKLTKISKIRVISSVYTGGLFKGYTGLTVWFI